MSVLSICVAVAAVFVSVYYYWYVSPNGEPASTLRAFALQEQTELANSTDVPLGLYSTYAGVGCVTAASREEAAAALGEVLGDVPPEIQTRILAMALPPAGESSNRYENNMSIDGEHTYILAFWHTIASAEEVKSCVSVAGAAAKPADRVVGTTTKKTQRTVGYTPCKCIAGYFCSSCPLLEEMEETVPLSVPVRWTAKQHREMQLVLRRQSVDMINNHPLEGIASGAPLRAISSGEAGKVRV